MSNIPEEYFDDSNNDEEFDKNKIAKLFYDFCFSSQIANAILVRTDDYQLPDFMFYAKHKSESIILNLFKVFLMRKGYEIEQTFDGHFKFNSSVFELEIDRTFLGNDRNYMEIMSNDFVSLKDEVSNDLAVATKFIIHVKNDNPEFIYIGVLDPLIDKYVIRQVFPDGVSTNKLFLESDDMNDIIDKILEFK